MLPNAGSAAAGYGARRLVVDSVLCENTVTNVTTAPLEMEIFEISLRKDLPKVWTYLQAGNSYIFDPNPIEYWYEGVNVGVNGSPGSQTAGGTPGCTPYDSQFFKDYFKVDRKSIVLLPQGGSHRHFTNFHPNTLVKEDELDSCYGTKRLNRWVMINVKGLPIVDKTTPGAIRASPATATLSWVQTRRIKFQFVLDALATFTYVNGLSYCLGSNSFLINTGSGQYEAQTGYGVL